jgi:hypothetical protein
MLEHQAQYAITEAALLARREQLTASRFQQLAILDTGRTDLFTGTATKASINMSLKCRGVAREPPFADRAHQVKTSTGPVILVAGDHVSGTGFQA